MCLSHHDHILIELTLSLSVSLSISNHFEWFFSSAFTWVWVFMFAHNNIVATTANSFCRLYLYTYYSMYVYMENFRNGKKNRLSFVGWCVWVYVCNGMLFCCSTRNLCSIDICIIFLIKVSFPLHYCFAVIIILFSLLLCVFASICCNTLILVSILM